MHKTQSRRGKHVVGSKSFRSRSDINKNSTDTTLQWHEKYAPLTLEEVAIHKKKLKDVTISLETMLSGESTNRILLLTGPAGCSKSTVVKLLSNLLVPKYRNSSPNSLRNSTDKKYFVEYDEFCSGTSPMQSFSEFLDQARYRLGRNLAVILVEDIPNVMHGETRVKFRSSLLQWLCDEDKLPPLLICLTECELPEGSGSSAHESSFIAETVLGKEILSHPKLCRIKFNPINTSLMTSRLRHIATCEKTQFSKSKWAQLPQFIKELANGPGDIRSAISMLEFWCYSSNSSGLVATRQSSINYFHAVGKVIYGSKDCTDQETIDSLLDTNHQINDTFLLGILENYSNFNKKELPMKSALEVADVLSEFDLLNHPSGALNDYNEVVLRKIRRTFRLLEEERGQHGMATFPREWKVRESQNKFRSDSEDFGAIEFYKYGNYPSQKTIALSLSFYAPLIRNTRNFMKKCLHYYLSSARDKNAITKMSSQHQHNILIDSEVDYLKRIGGNIQSITPEAEFVEFEPKEEEFRLLDRRNKILAILRKNQEFDPSLLKQEEHLEETEFDKDPIVESSVEEFTLDDDSLYEVLTQQPAKPNSLLPPATPGFMHDESLSDSDLENL
ncbi:HGL142Cp [Eremothecium sinecaudum]|uniref:HGL142Cp n=1 Tax=Eremothecium sinecaudum TaxID=45286 RepID=A0A109V092_9SACH|nr:HGL142Cp [Eremothecium sinecaudum]AMD22198.1 HGL142Cp [Eremothecium sinecaudum]